MTDVTTLPRWARDLHQSLSVNPQFLLWGNIRDSFLIERDGQPAFLGVLEVLWEVLAASGFELLLVHDPVDGLRVLPRDADAPSRPREPARDLVSRVLGDDGVGDRPLTLDQLGRVVRSVVHHRDHRVALVVDYASRLVAEPEDLTDPERVFFTQAQKLSHVAAPVLVGDVRPTPLYNPVIWLADEERDLPSWFAGHDSPVRIVPVPEPHLGQRRAAAQQLVGALGTDPDRADAVAEEFAAATHGLSIANHVEVVRLARDAGITPERIGDAVRAFKVGVLEDPWTRPDLRDRVCAQEERIRGQILGQDRAITRTFDILKRTVMGLSGAQAGRSGRPRGVLFLAGPTGVGKTELARQVAETVFGDAEAYLRFDMSEFAQEHAEARLLGAPPGYIGHGAGGELTRAIREQPFRLVLFDEIEKAHERLLDKFLQVLDDGRLTDGHGDTVHFSETIIVFTSNLGVIETAEDGRRVRTVNPTDTYDVIEQRIRTAIEDYFTYQLGRPELLTRIGDNIVVFDFIRDDVAPAIFDAFLRNVFERVADVHDLTLRLSAQAHETLQGWCVTELERGARGIAARLEGVLVNPLARALFETDPGRGSTVTVVDVRCTERGVEVELG